MRVLQIVGGLDPIYGGPSYSVPRLCEALAAADARVVLLSVAGSEPGPTRCADKGYADWRFDSDCAEFPVLRQLRHSSGLASALRNAPGVNVIHNHGLWLMPNVEAGWTAARGGTPLVISPRGMLAPAALAFSRLKKKAFWALLQGPVVRRAACLHATSIAEYEELRVFGLDNPVAVIPNGIDIPEAIPARRIVDGGDRVVLFLGRLHPKKGVDRLLRAWAAVERQHPEWRLRIAGPAEQGHDKELRSLTASMGFTRVTIEGPVYGAAKWQAYRSADLFVLPSLNENFALTAAEALAAGTPVIASKGTPWSGLESEGCGWWVEHGAEPMAAALTEAMAMPREALRAMGLNGRAWMARDFSWERVAHDTLDVYRWLADGSERPSVVRLN